MIKTIMNYSEMQTVNAKSFDEYFAQVQTLVENEQTSGLIQSETLIGYTKLNLQRMKRLNKTAKPGAEIKEFLKNMNRAMNWVLITEAWCGDAAQSMSYIHNLSQTNDNINFEVIYRDENVNIMNQYLTNGSMAIPKLVMLDGETGEELAHWGPRPKALKELIERYKEDDGKGFDYQNLSEMIHHWYAQNKNLNLEEELLSLLKSIQ